jgi:hypothetical protein
MIRNRAGNRPPLKKVDEKTLTKMHTMLKRLGIMDLKQDLIDTYAFRGRYIFTSKSLFEKEAAAIIKFLKGLQLAGETDVVKITGDIYCRKIFSCFKLMGPEWNTPERKLDMTKVHGWIMNQGYLKKHLKKYTNDELKELVLQVQNMRDDYLEALKKTRDQQVDRH